MHYVSDTAIYSNIVFVGLYLVLTYTEMVNFTSLLLFSYFGLSINCRIFLSGLYKLFKSDLINLIFDIFKYADSAYVTGHLLLACIEKSISIDGDFLVTFYWLISCVSWMSYYFSYLNYATYFRHVQRIKHCLYLRLFIVFMKRKFNSNYYVHF